MGKPDILVHFLKRQQAETWEILGKLSKSERGMQESLKSWIALIRVHPY